MKRPFAMLQFQSRQFDTLSEQRSIPFSERLRAHLATSYADHLSDWPPEAVTSFADAAVRAAAQWGFRAERDIAELAMLIMEMKLVAREQRLPDWFARIVTDESLHTPAKLYHLIACWQTELPRAQRGSGYAASGTTR
ncbi:MAG: hypothetical protein WCI59_13385 [Betaproteobacteria bacterium]